MYMVLGSDYPLDLWTLPSRDNGVFVCEGVGKYRECLFLSRVVRTRTLTKVADGSMELALLQNMSGSWQVVYDEAYIINRSRWIRIFNAI